MKLPERARVYLSGGGGGLGRAFALQLAAKHRARLLVCDVQLGAAEETARLVRERGGEAIARRTDVTAAADVEAAASALDEAWGGVDVVINNAGVAGGGAVGDFALEDWRHVLGVNLWGVVHGCHVFAPRLRRQKSGFVLNVASAAGFASLPEMSAYNVSKAGVISLSETLFCELGPLGVHVTVVCPTFFKSNLLQGFRAPSERPRELAQRFFDKARINADDVARAALAGLEKGQLHVVLPSDATAVWIAKRLVPGIFMRGVRDRAAAAIARMRR